MCVCLSLSIFIPIHSNYREHVFNLCLKFSDNFCANLSPFFRTACDMRKVLNDALHMLHTHTRVREKERTICKLKNLMLAHKKNLSHKEWYRLIINYFKLNTYIHMQQQLQRYQRKRDTANSQSWQRRIRIMLRKVLALLWESQIGIEAYMLFGVLSCGRFSHHTFYASHRSIFLAYSNELTWFPFYIQSFFFAWYSGVSTYLCKTESD